MTAPYWDDDIEEQRSLAHIPADEITSYSVETVTQWLLERNEQHRARLLAACQSLRTATDGLAASHQRLAAAVAGSRTS